MEFHKNKENGVRGDNDTLGAAGKRVYTGRLIKQTKERGNRGLKGLKSRRQADCHQKTPDRPRCCSAEVGVRAGLGIELAASLCTRQLAAQPLSSA